MVPAAVPPVVLVVQVLVALALAMALVLVLVLVLMMVDFRHWHRLLLLPLLRMISTKSTLIITTDTAAEHQKKYRNVKSGRNVALLNEPP